MPALRGPQRRTHSRATASVRSPMPPGQQPRNIADTSRSVSDSALLEDRLDVFGDSWIGAIGVGGSHTSRIDPLPSRH